MINDYKDINIDTEEGKLLREAVFHIMVLEYRLNEKNNYTFEQALAIVNARAKLISGYVTITKDMLKDFDESDLKLVPYDNEEQVKHKITVYTDK